MVCGKCGAVNADTVSFCTECGTKLDDKLTSSSNTAQQTEASGNYRKIGVICVAIAAMVIGMVAFLLFGGRGYKTVVNNYCKAAFDKDAKAIIRLMPGKYVDYIMDREGYKNKKEMIEDLREELEKQVDPIEERYGNDWSVSFKTVNVRDGKDLSGYNYDHIKESYEDMDIQVSEAKYVEVEITFKAGETETTNTKGISVIKIGRSWYLDLN